MLKWVDEGRMMEMGAVKKEIVVFCGSKGNMEDVSAGWLVVDVKECFGGGTLNVTFYGAMRHLE